MAAEPAVWDAAAEARFRESFQSFHREFVAATDAGVDLGALLAILEDEGVELPEFVRMML